MTVQYIITQTPPAWKIYAQIN